MAWKKGVKSLYYCRSMSIQRAETVSGKSIADANVVSIPFGGRVNDGERPQKMPEIAPALPLAAAATATGGPRETVDYDECLACQSQQQIGRASCRERVCQYV